MRGTAVLTIRLVAAWIAAGAPLAAGSIEPIDKVHPRLVTDAGAGAT